MRVITLDRNKKIVGIKNVEDNCILGLDDMVSEKGEMGQVLQVDGKFINDNTPPTIVPIIVPTNTEIMNNQITMMDLIVSVLEHQMGVV